MNNIFRTCGCLCFLYMGLFFLLTPLNAAPTGEIIFVHPINRSEIWISNVEGSTARKLFRQMFGDIDKIEVQGNGEYVLVVADKAIAAGDGIRAFLGNYDIYLLDRKNPIRKAKNLTLGRFPNLIDADISRNGDVIFVERPGLMLIRNDELAKPEPEPELLLDIGAWEIYDIEWSPDGKHIAFSTLEALFLLDVSTKDIFRITERADSPPVFSPNGKQIAFSTFVERNGKWATKAIAVAPVQLDADAEIVHVKKDYIYNVDAWSPDGKFIAYGSYIDPGRIKNIELFRSRGNFVIPATGGEPKPILMTMKDTVLSLDWDDKAYAVEPADALVTTWGALKARKTGGR
ncbi:PD40 domain-containing protein [Candidatus Poribacteria bacterium]|nr:PD40 domain-containing protein [Candidatus Poribacteria bacterium]